MDYTEDEGGCQMGDERMDVLFGQVDGLRGVLCWMEKAGEGGGWIVLRMC